MSGTIVPLNLPQPDLKLARKNNQVVVWDALRKKYLVLTPEEWVRQHLVHYLQSACGVPASAIALESGFRLNTKLQRTDILVFKNRQPVLLVECKAPQIKLSQETFDQAARYNLKYKVHYLLISNGLKSIWAKVDFTAKRYEFLQDPMQFSAL